MKNIFSLLQDKLPFKTGKAKEDQKPTEIPRQLHIDTAPHGAWNDFPIGVKENGDVVYWDAKSSPHLALTGAAGSGKSMFLRNVVFHCLLHPNRWRVIGVDVTRGELTSFAKYEPNVLGVAKNLEDGLEACRYASEQMWERYKRMEEKQVNHILDLDDAPSNLLLVIDSAASFLTRSGSTTEEGKYEDELREEAYVLIDSIARLGRAAGVHVALSTQRPDRSVIFGELWQNLTTKIVMGKVDSIHSTLALGSEGATTTDGTVKGRGYYKEFYGPEGEFQSYFADIDWLDRKINDIPAGLDITGQAVYWDPSAGK